MMYNVNKLFYSYDVKILSELTLSRQGPAAMVRPVPWLCTERILSEQPGKPASADTHDGTTQ